jgi:hypothetical protein
MAHSSAIKKSKKDDSGSDSEEEVNNDPSFLIAEPPPNFKPIGIKWVWKNKEGENGEVVRNKSRLVAQAIVRRR